MKKNKTHLAIHRKLEKGEYVLTIPLGPAKVIRYLGSNTYRVKTLGGGKWNLSIKLIKKLIDKKDWIKEKQSYKEFAGKLKKRIESIKIPPKKKKSNGNRNN